MGMLSQEELTGFHSRGYYHCPGVFSAAEIEQAQKEADRLLELPDLWEPLNIRTRFKNCAATGNPYREALDPVCDLAPCFDQMRHSPKIQEVLTQFYGEPAVCIKDKLLYKPPMGTGYDLHQDYIAWDEFPVSCMVALVAMDDSDELSGGVEMWPGRHHTVLSPADGAYYNLDPAVLEGAPGEFVSLKPGDVFFFTCLVPHQSGVNRSDHHRRHLYLTYHPASAGNLRAAYYARHLRWVQEAFVPNAFIR